MTPQHTAPANAKREYSWSPDNFASEDGKATASAAFDIFYIWIYVYFSAKSKKDIEMRGLTGVELTGVVREIGDGGRRTEEHRARRRKKKNGKKSAKSGT